MAILPTIHGNLVVPDDIDSIASTNHFVLPKNKFYPAKISIYHPQLRNLVTSPEHHIVNYASGQHVFQHNLKKNTLTLVATLPFKVRCASSGFGFICLGCGDRGLFAVVTINPHGLTPQGKIIWGSNEVSDKFKPVTKLLDYGDHILNSVSIELIQGHVESNILDDAVAVMTSNDHTVRFFSLAQEVETACLDLAFPINHASISPDGRIMVAVGDYQRACFFEKWELPNSASPKSMPGEYASSCVEWLELRLVDLHVTQLTPVIAYFSTAWSPSGQHCAVASECGFVTVFDMHVLFQHPTVEEPIPVGEVSVFVTPSSRPDIDCGAGAVRAMAFSAAPHQLLVWMEGQGRICVADMRNQLRTRQVIHLDPSTATEIAPTPTRTDDLLDNEESLFASIIPTTETSLAANLMASMNDRRASRRRPAVPSSSNTSFNSPSMAGAAPPALISGTRNSATSLGNRVRSSFAGQSSSSSTPRPLSSSAAGSSSTSSMFRTTRVPRTSTLATSRAISEATLNAGGDNSSWQWTFHSNNGHLQLTIDSPGEDGTSTTYQQFSYNGPLSNYERNLQDELNAEVYTENNYMGPGSLSRPSNGMPQTITARSTHRIPRLPRTTTPTHDWQGIEIPIIRHVRSDWDDFSDDESSNDSKALKDTPLGHARRRARRLRKAGQLHPNMEILNTQRMSGMGTDVNGVHMTGLCVSKDGPTVYVGSEGGVFELTLNLTARLYYPCTEDMR